MERMIDSSKLRSILQQQSETNILTDRIAELTNWIKEFSVKANLCSYEILHVPCTNCKCFRTTKEQQ